MRDARSPWSWSGNSYRGHMAWKTAAAGKTASNSPSVRMNFHVLLVLMSPRTMLRRFVLCFSVCVQERTFYFSVEKKKKKSFQAKHVWFMLPRTWICLDLGFNKTNCKACRKAARFCAYRTFFFCFCSLENSLWPQLLRWTLYLHLCLTSALQQIFIHLALLQPPQFFLHSSSHPLLLVSYWPFVLPLSSSSSSSPISLFFSSPSLSLSLQSPTSSWTQLLVSCSWLIIPHGNIFSVDVRELLLLLMKILNIAAPAQPHQKKKMWMVGGEKAGNQLFLLSSKYCHVWWRFYKLLRCIFSIC